LPRAEALQAAALGLACLLLYLLTLQPGLGLVDSGVFSAAALQWGVGPSTGYPLYTLLGRAACLSGLDPALCLNLLSALFASACCALFYLLCLELGSSRMKALGLSLLLAFSCTFWSRAVTAKMYSLHWALACALLLSALKARSGSARAESMFFLMLGLSLANHGQTVLLLPALLLVHVPKPKAVHALLLLAGISLYLILPLRSLQSPPVNWGGIHDGGSFWRHLSAWQQRESMAASKDFAANLLYGMKLWQNQYGMLLGSGLVIASAAGFFRIWNSDRRLALALGSAPLIQIPFCLQFNNSEVDAYYVPFYLCLLLFIAARRPGAASGWLGPGQEASASRGTAMLGLLGGVLAVMGGLWINFGRSDKRGDHLAERFVQNALGSLPQGSVVFHKAWDLESGALYMQEIRRWRRDIAVVDINLIYSAWYLDALRQRYPWLFPLEGDSEARFRNWVGLALQGKLGPENAAGRAGMELDYRRLLLALRAKAAAAKRRTYALFPASLRKGSFEAEERDLLGADWHPEGLLLALEKGEGKPEWDLRGISEEPLPLDQPSYEMAVLYALGLRNMGAYAQAQGRVEEGADLDRRGVSLRRQLAERYGRGIRKW
jgi:hypothetical protein